MTDSERIAALELQVENLTRQFAVLRMVGQEPKPKVAAPVFPPLGTPAGSSALQKMRMRDDHDLRTRLAGMTLAAGYKPLAKPLAK